MSVDVTTILRATRAPIILRRGGSRDRQQMHVRLLACEVIHLSRC
jgi:hypothetical protein